MLTMGLNTIKSCILFLSGLINTLVIKILLNESQNNAIYSTISTSEFKRLS